MTHIEIVRIEHTATETIGFLKIDGYTQCFTLELPKKGNKRDISCIPTGDYFCKQYISPKFNVRCIKLYDVYDREYISIHPGNTTNDIKGCILVGAKLGQLNGKRAVLNSASALEKITLNSQDIIRLSIK